MGYVDTQLEKLASTFVQEQEKTRLALEAGFLGSLRGMRLTGALPRPVQPNAINYAAGGRLVGWSIQATGGPVRILVHDGQGTGGDVIAVIDLADQENETQWNGHGVSFIDSIYLECTGAGSLTGSLWIGAVD